jgi:hypothetical protein
MPGHERSPVDPLANVVVEITGRHPQAWMNDLWLRFHGIVRPEGPRAEDAVAALEELGVPLERENHILKALGTGV